VKRSVARKPAPKKVRRAVSRAGGNALEPVRRQVGPGRFDPRYKAALLEQSSKPEIEPRAFIDSPRRPRDDLAEELGEEVIERATTGEDDTEETLDAVVPEEQGGPFVETSAAQEFAHDVDPSNPRGAKREPFPTT
jgi:hypothetical protein